MKTTTPTNQHNQQNTESSEWLEDCRRFGVRRAFVKWSANHEDKTALKAALHADITSAAALLYRSVSHLAFPTMQALADHLTEHQNDYLAITAKW